MRAVSAAAEEAEQAASGEPARTPRVVVRTPRAAPAKEITLKFSDVTVGMELTGKVVRIIYYYEPPDSFSSFFVRQPGCD